MARKVPIAVTLLPALIFFLFVQMKAHENHAAIVAKRRQQNGALLSKDSQRDSAQRSPDDEGSRAVISGNALQELGLGTTFDRPKEIDRERGEIDQSQPKGAGGKRSSQFYFPQRPIKLYTMAPPTEHPRAVFPPWSDLSPIESLITGNALWKSKKQTELSLTTSHPLNRRIVSIHTAGVGAQSRRLQIVRVNSTKQSLADEDPRYSLFKVAYSAEYNGVSFQNTVTGTFLSRQLDGAVALDRIQAKSFEHWKLEWDEGWEGIRIKAATEDNLFLRWKAGEPFTLSVRHSSEGPGTSATTPEGQQDPADVDRVATGVKKGAKRKPNALERETLFTISDATQAFLMLEPGEEIVTEVAKPGKLPSDGSVAPHGPAEAKPLHVVLTTTTKPLSKMSSQEKIHFFFVLVHWVGMARAPHTLDIIICWENDAAVKEFASELRGDEEGVKLGHEDLSRLKRSGNLHHRTDCETHPKFPNIPTYRGMFAVAKEFGQKDSSSDPTEGKLTSSDPRLVIGYANADIVFQPLELEQTLEAVLGFRDQLSATRQPENGQKGNTTREKKSKLSTTKASRQTPQFLVTGRRRNCPPKLNGTDETPLSQRWFDLSGGRSSKADHGDTDGADHSAESCVLFGEDAQDYFFTSPDLFDWAPGSTTMPPLVVGGIAFDNYLVSQANKLSNAFVVDATATLSSYHIDHGASRFDSHKDPKSLFNSKLAHESGGWSRGKVSLNSFSTLPTLPGWGKVIVYERHVLTCSSPPCSVVHYNQQDHSHDPPDAFSQPWRRPD
jgi:hypothetical protein